MVRATLLVALLVAAFAAVVSGVSLKQAALQPVSLVESPVTTAAPAAEVTATSAPVVDAVTSAPEEDATDAPEEGATDAAEESAAGAEATEAPVEATEAPEPSDEETAADAAAQEAKDAMQADDDPNNGGTEAPGANVDGDLSAPKPEMTHYELNGENSKEPVYREASTAEKEASEQKMPAGPPVVLPFGTKISVPGLPPGSRVNPGGITPKQRAFDATVQRALDGENMVNEEEELTAERNAAEGVPGGELAVDTDNNADNAAKEVGAEPKADCTDCTDAMKKIGKMAEKMEEDMGKLDAQETTTDEGYGEEAAAAPAADEGYGEEAAAEPAAADEGYGEEAAAAPAAKEAAAAEPAAAAEGYGEDAEPAAAAEGYGEDAEPAAAGEGAAAGTDDGYGEEAAAEPAAAAEGYGEESESTEVVEGEDGKKATTDTTEASEELEGEEEAGAVPLEPVEFLEISSSFTPENFLQKVNGVHAPLPKLLQ